MVGLSANYFKACGSLVEVDVAALGIGGDVRMWIVDHEHAVDASRHYPLGV